MVDCIDLEDTVLHDAFTKSLCRGNNQITLEFVDLYLEPFTYYHSYHEHGYYRTRNYHNPTHDSIKGRTYVSDILNTPIIR